jgi:hypothetical protein
MGPLIGYLEQGGEIRMYPSLYQSPSSSQSPISACWPGIKDPGQFVLRFASAIRQYLTALLADSVAAEAATQHFLHKCVRHVAPVAPSCGRYRDYLQNAVREAAVGLARSPSDQTLGDRAWLGGWRACLLERAWLGLDTYQRDTRGNVSCTVLRVAADYPDEDPTMLAGRVNKLAGRRLRAEAFRKQLGRARRIFAELLVGEVVQTLDKPSPQGVEAELAAVGLLPELRDSLPAAW